MTDTPKRRGRPRSLNPKTSADRMKAARERVQHAIDTDTVTELPDHLLLEAIAMAYRAQQNTALFDGVISLLRRCEIYAIPNVNVNFFKYSSPLTKPHQDTIQSITYRAFELAESAIKQAIAQAIEEQLK